MDMIMMPSKIRARVLDDHNTLRAMLAELSKMLKSHSINREPPFDRLKEKTIDMLRFLKAHMHLEDDILLPFLATVDSWGTVRSEKFRAEHKEQYERIRQIEANLNASGKTQLDGLDIIESFLDWLKVDMESEEEEFLNENLLRDDLTNLDYFGG